MMAGRFSPSSSPMRSRVGRSLPRVDEAAREHAELRAKHLLEELRLAERDAAIEAEAADHLRREAGGLEAAAAAAAQERERLVNAIAAADQKARDEEVAGAAAVRQSEEGLAREQGSARQRIMELEADYLKARQQLEVERASRAAGVEEAAQETANAVARERRAAADRLKRVTMETHGSLVVTQEQLQELKAQIEGEKRRAQEAAERRAALEQAVERVKQETADEAERQRRREEEWKVRAAGLRSDAEAAQRAAEETEGESNEARRLADALQRQLAEMEARTEEQRNRRQQALRQRAAAEEQASSREAAVASVDIRTQDIIHEAEQQRARAELAEEELRSEQSRRSVAEGLCRRELGGRRDAERRTADAAATAANHLREGEDQFLRATSLQSQLSTASQAREQYRVRTERDLIREQEESRQVVEAVHKAVREEQVRSTSLARALAEGRSLPGASPPRPSARFIDPTGVHGVPLRVGSLS
eukprot:Hpha_TRINITY_DN18477_c0_g1::TRINITY_DN18477_c0_g1_i1::g.165474::m.165474